MKCSVCYAWRPTKWEGWRYTDEVAFCAVHGCDKRRSDSCDKGGILPPHDAQVESVSRKAVDSAPRKATIAVNDCELYSHQVEAIERFDHSTEVPLFMEMGCGKSATILEIVARKVRRGEVDALLIIAPNGVHVQWYNEQLVQWFSVPYEAQCLFGRGGKKVAIPFDDEPGIVQVVCVNVDTFSTPNKWKDIVAWANSRKTFIVLDEATCIKNVDAKRTQRILYEFNEVTRKGKTILSSVPRSVGRAILTGTPVTNGPMDLWAMMEFLRHNFFGRNWYSFRSYYCMFTKMAVGNGGSIREIEVPLTEEWWHVIKKCKSYGEAYALCGCSESTFFTVHSQDHYQGPYKNADELRTKLHEVAYFKQLKECVDMPQQVYNRKVLVMDDDLRACYDSMVNEFIAQYEDCVATALNKLSVIIRLQQISSGFLVNTEEGVAEEDEDPKQALINRLYGLSDDVDVLPSDKVTWIGNTNAKLEALYRDIDESSKPLIVITHFTAEASRIYEDLKNRYSCCLMTGWKCVGSVDAFKAGKYEVLVANAATIAHGYNLQNSCSILFYSNSFSLEKRLQIEGRIFRLGQKQPCLYTDYVYEDSIDEKIYAVLKMKRDLLEYIRDADMRELLT